MVSSPSRTFCSNCLPQRSRSLNKISQCSSCPSWLISFRFRNNMNIERLHIGMKVRHPQYGVGTVRSLSEKTAEIEFDDEQRTIAPEPSDLQPAESTATLSELQMPLAN